MEIRDTLSSMELAFIAEISEKYNLGNWSETDYKNAYFDPSYKILITDENTDVYGFIIFRILYDEIEIINICVDASFRGKGVAKLLLNQCIFESKILNKKKIWLEVRESNDVAIKLYTDFGFSIFGGRKEYYNNPVEDAVIMFKSLIS